MTDKEDKGYCGLEPLETGKHDPFWKDACKPHDVWFNRLKAGKLTSGVDDGILATTGKFVASTALVAVKGAYAVAAAPIYIVIGGLGGMLRWAQIKVTGRKD